MTRSICSTCRASISADAPYCPRCGPSSLRFIVSEETEALERGADPDTGHRLAAALGRDYEVVRLLGRGGFAEVYEVRDLPLQRRLALKVLRPDLAWSANTLSRFKQEARAIARLNHPHTVPIHFVGEGDGLVYYAMPFIEGRSLGEILRRDGALEPQRAVALAIPLLEALEHAHRHGLVHRDLKPDNVMVEARTGRPLLVDFGIVKSLDGEGHQTLTGYVVGTPLYMSPEQALGQRTVDARSDVYAFGAMLFQMLTGSPPFEGQTSQEIVEQHLTRPAPAPRTRNAAVPGWLSAVIVRCMAKRPGERYPSAAAVAEALRAGATGDVAGAVTEQLLPAAVEPSSIAPTPSPRAPRRARRLVPLLASAGVLTALGIGTAVASRPRPSVLIENRLAEPVRVRVAGNESQAIAPGESLRVTVARGEAFRAEWRLVRPIDASGRPLGEELGGRLRAEGVRGDVRRYIELGALDTPYFAPVIDNRTAGPLHVRVLAGPADAAGCDCTVGPHAARSHLGYYPLAPQSAVVVRDSAGRSMRFADLAASAPAENGLVSLVVEAENLHSETTAPAITAAAPRSGTPPHHQLPPPAEPVESVRRIDSGAKPKPKPPSHRADDPLRGIFPNR